MISKNFLLVNITMFEIIKSDLRGRIAHLYTNHGKIETPAYVPVIHPTNQIVPTKKIKTMGFNMVITNAYITKKHYGENAIKKGIHKIIKFDGAVMTDSGGYQVLEYGDIKESHENMAKFETGLKADITIPLDKPTGYGLAKNQAKLFVEHTLKISRHVLKNKSEQIWAGPIQGSEHLDLIQHSVRSLLKYGFKMLALGSPVELMVSYKYRLLANIIIAAKKYIPHSVPLHLFGSGHPLTIALSVALGCDTFDSASYVLYAKNGRYITDDRTRNLSDMKYFACNCDVCNRFTPKELIELNRDDLVKKIALHNLFAIKIEVDRVKEAIHEGRLWEYVIKKARSHPKLFEIISTMCSNYDYFIPSTPIFKKKSVFLFSYEDQYRPEIMSYHKIVRKFKTKKKYVVIIPDNDVKPMYVSPTYNHLKTKFSKIRLIQFCQYNQFLGIIPVEISDVYPASHYDMANIKHKPELLPVFTTTWKKFFENNKFSILYTKRDDAFISYFTKLLPKEIIKKTW